MRLSPIILLLSGVSANFFIEAIHNAAVRLVLGARIVPNEAAREAQYIQESRAAIARAQEATQAQDALRTQEFRKEALINKNMKVLTIAPSGNEAVKLAIPVEGDPKKIEADHAACLICMEPYKDGADLGLLKCNHHADRACLKNWLHYSNTCPMCRKPAW